MPEYSGIMGKKKMSAKNSLSALHNIPVNSEKYIMKKENAIPVNEKFFYQ